MTPENLIDCRVAAGLTQATLAKYLGISERQVIRYENGKSKIPGPVSIISNNLISRKLPKLPKK